MYNGIEIIESGSFIEFIEKINADKEQVILFFKVNGAIIEETCIDQVFFQRVKNLETDLCYDVNLHKSDNIKGIYSFATNLAYHEENVMNMQKYKLREFFYNVKIGKDDYDEVKILDQSCDDVYLEELIIINPYFSQYHYANFHIKDDIIYTGSAVINSLIKFIENITYNNKLILHKLYFNIITDSLNDALEYVNFVNDLFFKNRIKIYIYPRKEESVSKFSANLNLK